MGHKATTWAWEQKLSATPKLVLLAIADCSNPEGVSWPGKKGMAEMCGLSPRCVAQQIRYLEREGLLRLEVRTGRGGRQISNLYLLALKGRFLPGGDAPAAGGEGERGAPPQGEPNSPPGVNVVQGEGERGAPPYKGLNLSENQSEEPGIRPPDSPAKKPYVAPRPDQKLILAFKRRLGVQDDDREWDRVNFKTWIRPAQSLLQAFGGDFNAALAYFADKSADYVEKNKIGWNLGWVARDAWTDPEVSRKRMEAQRG